jgi:hypothetical protein
MIGKVGGPGGSDFGRFPTSNSRAKASSPTARAMTVVCDNMAGDLFSEQKADWEAVGLECGAAPWNLYKAGRSRRISRV